MTYEQLIFSMCNPILCIQPTQLTIMLITCCVCLFNNNGIYERDSYVCLVCMSLKIHALNVYSNQVFVKCIKKSCYRYHVKNNVLLFNRSYRVPVIDIM